jgi:beta-glucanase (GH16 family)
MLGTNITSVGWPQCGEVDVMENIGREPSVNHGSLHGPGYSGGNSVTGLFTLPGGVRFSDDFHVFALQWAAQSVAFSVDGNTYRTVTPATLPPGAPWVFDNPFFLILNVAVGGNFPGRRMPARCSRRR